MHAALFAVLVVMADSPTGSPNPAALAAELGSPRYARREAAERALGGLGRPAIPALRAALASPDPEVRDRAAHVLGRIEGALLVEPTSIRLDFDDVPLAEAVTTINREAGLRLTLAPEAPALWAQRRITARSAAPLPFWRAVDALCAAGQLHYVFGGAADLDSTEPGFALFDGAAVASGRFDDHGPFRVQLVSLHAQSEVHLAGKPGAPLGFARDGTTTPAAGDPGVAIRQFYLQLLVGAEPRLTLSPGGPVRVLEAIDDQGRSRVAPSRGEFIEREAGYQGLGSSPLVHLRADLAYPEGPAGRLKKVKGVIPLVVSTRRPEPLAFGVADAAGRTFRQGGVELTVGELHPAGGEQPATIELTVRRLRDASARVRGGDDGEESDDAPDAVRALIAPDRLEVLDADGRLIPWFPSSTFHDGEVAHLVLTLIDRKGPAAPASIRYHDVIRGRTEVPFEFRDLPMP